MILLSLSAQKREGERESLENVLDLSGMQIHTGLTSSNDSDP
jgi:hypothetical protein